MSDRVSNQWHIGVTGRENICCNNLPWLNENKKGSIEFIISILYNFCLMYLKIHIPGSFLVEL